MIINICLKFFVLLLLLFHISCILGPKEEEPSENFIYPITIGNSWKYVQTEISLNCSTITQDSTYVVTDSIFFNRIDTILTSVIRMDTTAKDTPIVLVRDSAWGDTSNHTPVFEYRWKNKDDGLYFYDSNNTVPYGHPEQLYKYPYQNGSSWSNGEPPFWMSNIYLGKENVKCEAGTFMCYKIETKFTVFLDDILPSYKCYRWLSPEIGLVKILVITKRSAAFNETGQIYGKYDSVKEIILNNFVTGK